MKKLRFLQIVLLLLLCYFLIIDVDAPLYAYASKNTYLAKNGKRGRRRGYYRRHHRYHRYPRYYFRFYVTPPYRRYDYAYSQVYIYVRDDVYTGQRVLDVAIDGRSIYLSPPGRGGERGSYSYRLYSGYHTIEWSIQLSNGQIRRYSRGFYADYSNRAINISIDGSRIYLQ